MAFKTIKLSKDQLAEYVKGIDKNSDDKFFISLCDYSSMARYYIATTDWSFKAGCKNVSDEFKRSLGFSPLMILAILVTISLPLIMFTEFHWKLIQILKNRSYILKYKVKTIHGARQVKRTCELYRRYSK
jgi:hypothetical protein